MKEDVPSVSENGEVEDVVVRLVDELLPHLSKIGESRLLRASRQRNLLVRRLRGREKKENPVSSTARFRI